MKKAFAIVTASAIILSTPCLCYVQQRFYPTQLPASFNHRQAFKERDRHHGSSPCLCAIKRRLIKINEFRKESFLSAEKSSEDKESSDDPTSPYTETSLSQRLLPKGYILCKYLFAMTSLLIFATPDRSLGTLLLQKWSGGAGYACAAAICDILQTARANGRQGSDTYKRLHVALAVFSIANLVAIPGEAGFFRTSQQRHVISLLTSVRSLGAVVALWGWYTSLQKHATKELAEGFADTIKGLRVLDRKKALSYRNSLLIVLSAAISSFFQGRFLLRYQKDFLKTNFEISLQWSAVARLSMVAFMIFTLKDAAERDRLSGTTFIQLNVLVGLVSAAAGLGQAAYPVGAAARRGILFFFFSGLFFLKAYKGQLAKQLKER